MKWRLHINRLTRRSWNWCSKFLVKDDPSHRHRCIYKASKCGQLFVYLDKVLLGEEWRVDGEGRTEEVEKVTLHEGRARVVCRRTQRRHLNKRKNVLGFQFSFLSNLVFYEHILPYIHWSIIQFLSLPRYITDISRIESEKSKTNKALVNIEPHFKHDPFSPSPLLNSFTHKRGKILQWWCENKTNKQMERKGT